jgi:hypothetical protein
MLVEYLFGGGMGKQRCRIGTTQLRAEPESEICRDLPVGPRFAGRR